MKNLLLFGFILATPQIPFCQETEKELDLARVWKDSTGKFSLKATLKRFDDENVFLEKEDGEIVKVRRDRLSKTDREFLDSRSKPTIPHKITGARIKNRTNAGPILYAKAKRTIEFFDIENHVGKRVKTVGTLRMARSRVIDVRWTDAEEPVGYFDCSSLDRIKLSSDKFHFFPLKNSKLIDDDKKTAKELLAERDKTAKGKAKWATEENQKYRGKPGVRSSRFENLSIEDYSHPPVSVSGTVVWIDAKVVGSTVTSSKEIREEVADFLNKNSKKYATVRRKTIFETVFAIPNLKRLANHVEVELDIHAIAILDGKVELSDLPVYPDRPTDTRRFSSPNLVVDSITISGLVIRPRIKIVDPKKYYELDFDTREPMQNFIDSINSFYVETDPPQNNPNAVVTFRPIKFE